ncbi:MAG: FadR/GntR family transcriptional regulator [Actinomycetaceae bacterium]|nr:FadR/GntR family transcriptional regulator [Actinomycetaceae bacterium]
MPSDRVQTATTKILDAIASKHFKVGEALPPEAELAEWLEVARPTMREAVRALAERGVLNVVHGRGTFVVAPSQWTDLNSIIWWHSKNCSPLELGMYLVEVRRMIEVGASGLAAERRTESDIDRLRKTLENYDAAIEADDIDTATREDLEFHQAILSASHNPFLAAVMAPLSSALRDSRFLTTSVPEIRKRARSYHYQLLDAIEKSNAQEAKDVMRMHMTQTRNDIAKHLSD